jgi:integrase
MMTKSPAGSVVVKVSHNRLQLVFTRRKKRHYLSLGLSASSKQNRNYAEMVALIMQNDILGGNFDESLSKYRPDRETGQQEAEVQEKAQIRDIWDKYADFKRPQRSQTTMAIDYERVSRWIDRFPVGCFDCAIEVRNWLLKQTTPAQAKRILKQLSGCGKWAVDSKLIQANTFSGLASSINASKASRAKEAIDPFSAEERDLIIQAFKDSGNHYATLVELLFRTGCRPSEAIALQWADISKDFKAITFQRAITTGENNRLAVKEGLKTQSKRVLPCGSALTEFLRSIAPDSHHRESFIFSSPTGCFVDLENFSSRDWRPTLTKLGIKPRGIYHTRHTFITNCLDSGMDAKDVAKLVGNSPEIIYKHYAGANKDVRSPDF